MIDDELDFLKYDLRGAYHWQQISPSIRHHNAFVSARYDMILREIGNIQGSTILDLGGGDGVLSFLMTKKGASATILDGSLKALSFARKEFSHRNFEAKVISGSVYELPFQASFFDIVVCSDVIEHVQKPQFLLSEAKRVLQAGGLFVLTTPLRVTEQPIDIAHIREYYSSEIDQLMKEQFENVSVKTFAPVVWLELFKMRFRWLARRPFFRYLFNFSTIYLHRNPFIQNSPYHYLSMLISSGRKSGAKLFNH
jgi:2-polyprenyl-3-methyl-5-hydroxy-6-metoxy-1,4-benzoquinol methylase